MWCPAPASSCSVCPEKPHPDLGPAQLLSINRVASPWSLPGLRCLLYLAFWCSSWAGTPARPSCWAAESVFSQHLYRYDPGTVSGTPSWTGQDSVCLEGGKQPTEKCFLLDEGVFSHFPRRCLGRGSPWRTSRPGQGCQASFEMFRASGWVPRTSFKFRIGRKNKPMHQNKSLGHPD